MAGARPMRAVGDTVIDISQIGQEERLFHGAQIIGVEIGGNLAFLSSSIYPEVKTAVSISPQFREGQPSLGPQYVQGLSDFQPNSILFLAAFGDGFSYTSAESMAQQTASPVRVMGYQGAASGYFLLREADPVQEILSWLSVNL